METDHANYAEAYAYLEKKANELATQLALARSLVRAYRSIIEMHLRGDTTLEQMRARFEAIEQLQLLGKSQ